MSSLMLCCASPILNGCATRHWSDHCRGVDVECPVVNLIRRHTQGVRSGDGAFDGSSFATCQSVKGFPPVYRSSTDRYTVQNGLLKYSAVAGDTPRVVVPDHGDLRLRIMDEYHDASNGGRRGREKTYLTVSRDFYCPASISSGVSTSAHAKYVNE